MPCKSKKGRVARIAPPCVTRPSGGDLISALMGDLASGGGAPAQQASQSGGGDLMGALLGGLTGAGSGGSGLQALTQAFLGGSDMGRISHRTQSTEVVVDSFLRALSQSGRKP